MAAIFTEAPSLGIWERCSSPKSRAGGVAASRPAGAGGGGRGSGLSVEEVGEVALVVEERTQGRLGRRRWRRGCQEGRGGWHVGAGRSVRSRQN
ncbi:hypothetical protein E2562_006540 [Oryza meyeriana var. granulata]|uniref:DUF834 domain-containing protein n=1 Tax=Oryza meyeriana var. granulata TaxID=110450 RepID=A0A6G1BTN3_9ORYZ|nr:hypothetical protein E2562_006540 [Oryza meyeriana var. granulata]